MCVCVRERERGDTLLFTEDREGNKSHIMYIRCHLWFVLLSVFLLVVFQLEFPECVHILHRLKCCHEVFNHVCDERLDILLTNHTMNETHKAMSSPPYLRDIDPISLHC